MDKAMKLADIAIFDLEDAVSLTMKDQARTSVASFLSKRLNDPSQLLVGSHCAVRVNCPVSTQWGAKDLEVVSRLPFVDAIVLPKVESLESIQIALSLMGGQNRSNIPIWAMIETAKGVLNCSSIAAQPQLECLVFGSNDLTKDLKAKHTLSREPLLFSMSQCILAARAHGKRVLDGVHIDINDLDGLRQTATQARGLGFDGKSLIHPQQIDIVNECFSPSREEVQHARDIIDAWDSRSRSNTSAADAGDKGGVIVVNGQLVEDLHVEQARLVLHECALIEERKRH